MPSHLRLSTPFEPVPVNVSYQTSPTFPPSKKQKMSLTQTYYVASTARSKLGREAGRADHNLRLLVGHANLLDSLMVELADAEREQEAWFNQSVKTASKPDEPRHIRWIDTIREEDESEDEDEEEEENIDDDADSDAGSDVYDEDVEMYSNLISSRRPIRQAPVFISSPDLPESDEDSDSDFDSDDEYDEDGDLALVRTVSNHSPPELTLDSSESEDEDESMPASPEQPAFELSEKQRQAITTTNFYDVKAEHRGIEDYMISQPRQPLIAAC